MSAQVRDRWMGDCFVITDSGKHMPAQIVERRDADQAILVATPTGREFWFDAEKVITIEQLREKRAHEVADTYHFADLAPLPVVLVTGPKAQTYVIVYPEGKDPLCSCPAHSKDPSQPCKHIRGLEIARIRRLQQQNEVHIDHMDAWAA